MGAGLVTLGAACSGAPDGQPEAVGSSAQAITGSTILSRAEQWVTAKLLYCQAANGAPDLDPSCPSTCTRESNPAWDPYRSDCSGFVAWAWGLPPPGNTTSEYAPADTSVSYVIKGIDLEPGDALNIPGDHIVLFVSWVTVGSEANFYEEPGCSATPDYAHAFTSTVSISGSDVTIDYEGSTFTAIRYTGVTGAGDAGGATDSGPSVIPCTVTKTGDMGDCLDTTVCASKGGVSTADFCPGPASIQCCTGIPAPPPPDAGTKPAPDAGAAPVDSGTIAPDAGVTPPDDAGTGTGPKLEGGTPAHDGGGSTSGDAEGRGTPAFHRESAGCSATPSRGELGDGAWLFALGAVGLATTRRRRRQRRDDSSLP
jgi:MYXO-CTERM domain-containing protein